MAGGWVYFLTNRPNGILYAGVTSDIAKRAFEHREGAVKGFTKRYGLKRLVYYERFDDVRDAIQREKTIKHWSHAWKVRLIHGMNPEWNNLYDTFLTCAKKDVDGRDKPGHDGEGRSYKNTGPATPRTI